MADHSRGKGDVMGLLNKLEGYGGWRVGSASNGE